ncbi:MAG: InlB B-repeat-containing protein [Lachnospiraceae bacterium]|nr:InlB B-repeat-containing protein [Lachnospiraceae bacterium]
MNFKRLAVFAATTVSVAAMSVTAFGKAKPKPALPVLTEAPTIYAGTIGDGLETNVWAYFENSDEILELSREVNSYADYNGFTADWFGVDKDKVSELCFFIQAAYSLDGGTTWINDFDWDEEHYASWEQDSVCIDEDKDIWAAVPSDGLSLEYLFDDIRIMDLSFWVSNNTEVANAAKIAKYLGQNKASKVDENEKNMEYYTVDLVNSSMLIKARYILVATIEGDEDYIYVRSYSPWSNIFTLNTSFSPLENDWITGSGLKYEKPVLEDVYDNYYHGFGIIPQGNMKDFLSQRGFAYDDGYMEDLYEITDTNFVIFVEMKINDGDWFNYISVSAQDAYFTIYDSDRLLSELEESFNITLQPEDEVFLRAKYIIGGFVWDEIDADNNRYIAVPNEFTIASTDYSNVIQINVTGAYTIRYELNEGEWTVYDAQETSFTVDDNYLIDLTSDDYTPAKDGYQFAGWYTTEDCKEGTEITSIDTGEKRFYTVYAKWYAPAEYTVTYDLIYEDAFYAGRDIYTEWTTQGLELGTPTLNGAVFKGWYTNKDYTGSAVTAIDPSLKKNLKYYAKWEFPSYKITYQLNNGTNAADNPAKFQAVPGTSYQAVLKPATRDGYIFDGWYYDAKFKNALSSNDAGTEYYLVASAKVTVYAKWIPGRADITYVNVVDGTVVEDFGVYNPNPSSYVYGTTVTLEALSFDGYQFDGWFSDAAVRTAATGISATDTGAKTFYAKWIELTYPVLYVLDRDPANSPALNTIKNVNSSIKRGGSVLELVPATTTNKIYKFAGWYTNSNLVGSPIESYSVNSPLTLYAKWTVESKPLPYTDVEAVVQSKGGRKPWYYTHLQFLYDRSIMTGLQPDLFGLGVQLTREQAATLLYRFAGSPEVTSDGNPFPDVTNPKHWAYKAVVWAKQNGVITGYTQDSKDGKQKAGYFGSQDPITREQLMTIFYRYAKSCGYNVSVQSGTSYKAVEDWKLVASWATPAINWGYEQGIIGNGSLFNPGANIVREEAATMLSRYIQGLKDLSKV